MRINLLIALGLAACVDTDPDPDPVTAGQLAAQFCATHDCSIDVQQTLQPASTFHRLPPTELADVTLHRFVSTDARQIPTLDASCARIPSKDTPACDDVALAARIPSHGCRLFQFVIDGDVLLAGGCKP